MFFFLFTILSPIIDRSISLQLFNNNGSRILLSCSFFAFFPQSYFFTCRSCSSCMNIFRRINSHVAPNTAFIVLGSKLFFNRFITLICISTPVITFCCVWTVFSINSCFLLLLPSIFLFCTVSSVVSFPPLLFIF